MAGAAGCMGGGEVIEEVQRSVRVEPGQYWSTELPDVSESGGAIEYVARADRAFDVYFFTGPGYFEAYRTGVDRSASDSRPNAHEELSTTAVPADDGGYQAATQDGGARQSLTDDGPYFFVLDHTGYGVGAQPGDPGETLSISLDLSLVRNRV